MFKLSTSFMVLVIATTTLAASAQQMRKSGMSGQEPGAGEAAATASVLTPALVPAPSHRLVITDTVTDPAGAAGQASDTGNDSLEPRPVAKHSIHENDVSSEFQKFILDNPAEVLPIFAPLLNSPVPGDDLLIRGWGTIANKQEPALC
ncbi:hypothetical protein [Massilia horti]|uniref:Uncharacterized protein n=1 Tax=Massilia horti TaxID=2562153 RepID=A0A4Y9T2D5_9BURK|nr:hypothetical protein [Massilia horti]TFW32058.1 hypothetical protein E4O92_11120 [Massilia horti]